MNTTMHSGRRTAALFALVLALAALGSAPAAAAPAVFSGPLVKVDFPAADSLSPFAKEGLASLSTFQLSNGIPVVVRKNDASPVQHVEIVLAGGARIATPGTAGYELLALKTMKRASTTSSYDDITALLDETSASMGVAGNLDYSSYSLTCLDRYFERLFPVWASTLTSPLFAQEDFDQVLSETKLAFQNKEKDPWARTGRQMNGAFFAGHPYAASPDGTKESLAAAKLDAVKSWYATSFSSDRIFVVASGDFETAELKASLEKAFAKIADRKVGYPTATPAPAGNGSLLKVEHPQSKGIAYVRGDFSAPSMSSPDFMAMNIGMKMFSDLLMNVVREKYGAVYTPGAYIRNTAGNYGSITIYKTNKTAKIKAYIDEAADDFAAGKALSTDPAAGDQSPRMTIDQALPVYKAQFTNDYFEKLQTNAAAADLIAQSIIDTGDCRYWLLAQQQINAVTADQIRASARKYLFDAKITWVALGSPDTLVPIVDADYAKLGTK